MKTRPETFDDLDEWRRRGRFVAGVVSDALDSDTEAGRALNTLLDVCRKSDDLVVEEKKGYTQIFTKLSDEEKLSKLRFYQEDFDRDTEWIGLIRDGKPIEKWKVEYAFDAAEKRGIDILPKPVIKEEE